MIKRFLTLFLVLFASAGAQDENPYASVVWTKDNVPNGCFPYKGGSMMLCEKYQNADNRSIKIIDAVNKNMYIYLKMEGNVSGFNVSHCNNLIALPNKVDDQIIKELSEGKSERFVEQLMTSMITGEWGWNCEGARSVLNLLCILNDKTTHYVKVTKYDEIGLVDSEKETTGTSAIGDFCRDRFDGI